MTSVVCVRAGRGLSFGTSWARFAFSSSLSGGRREACVGRSLVLFCLDTMSQPGGQAASAATLAPGGASVRSAASVAPGSGDALSQPGRLQVRVTVSFSSPGGPPHRVSFCAGSADPSSTESTGVFSSSGNVP